MLEINELTVGGDIFNNIQAIPDIRLRPIGATADAKIDCGNAMYRTRVTDVLQWRKEDVLNHEDVRFGHYCNSVVVVQKLVRMLFYMLSKIYKKKCINLLERSCTELSWFHH